MGTAASELLPAQKLIENALSDSKVNPQFKIEHSSDLQKALQVLNGYMNGLKKAGAQPARDWAAK